MKYLDKTIQEIHSLLKEKKIKPIDLVEECFERIEKNKDLNAYITLNKEEAIKTAKELENKEVDNLLFGLPIAVKDNIVTKGLRTTCASHILDNFIPIYDATVVEKIKKNKMSVREVEAYVRDVNGGGQKKPKKKEKDPMIRDLEIQLSEKLGTQVVFSKKNFTISYHDTDDLNRILELIGCLDESIHQS